MIYFGCHGELTLVVSVELNYMPNSKINNLLKTKFCRHLILRRGSTNWL